MPFSAHEDEAASQSTLRNRLPVHAGRGPRLLELALWLVAIVCFAILASASILAARAQRAAEAIVAATIQNSISPEGVNSAQDAAAPAAKQIALPVMGRLEIPALRLSVPITSGIETESLLGGVGHVNGSALPGGLGTVVLAGHRDTYLRPLEHIAKGMEILLIDRTGAYRYSVDRWEIVTPEQVDAIAIRSHPELALVTCYPFHFVGPAPRRFIVHAHLVSLIPQTR